ncbi:MAG: substrate-binding domain-containing protein [Deltaproteobacteria bacterium]|nr:substrate-binding domain-containing protein [Deltaproteobacteria bacterium]
MRLKATIVATVIAAVLVSWGMGTVSTAVAGEKVRYSCSAQVYQAFEDERLNAFTKETGVEIDLYVASSSSAVNRLMYGYSDIASTAQGLRYPEKESGYLETPFCKVPMAVIAGAGCSISNLSEVQLRDVFSGDVTNWKEVGGPDLPIVVIIPAKNTAAFRNFERLAMRRVDLKYDVMTYKSTMVIDVVKCFRGAISFAALGAVSEEKDIKTLSINGISAKHANYPYHQVFSFVTKGEPVGATKKFIDFVFSPNGLEMMKKRGMIPILP